MRSNSPRLPLRMIAIFLGGAQGKVSQNQIKSSVRAAHTKIKKQKTCGHLPTLDLQFIEAVLEFVVVFDFCF
jgi:hypothetical protein